MDLIKYGLMNKLIESLSTGYIFLDAFVAISISCIILNVDLETIRNFKNNKIFKYCFVKKKAHVNFNTRSVDISYNFKSIMHYIEKKKTDISHIKEINKVYYDYGIEEESMDSIFVADNCSNVKIADDIYVNIQHYNQEGKNKEKEKHCDFLMYTKKNNLKYLQDFIVKCNKEYDEFLLKQIYKGQLYFDCNFDIENKCIKKVKYSYTSSKNFDNIFFDKKDEVLKKINFFINNRQWYEKRGIPYTLGFLLYGEPGCGKTSFIKALLTHLNKHGISINLTGANKMLDLLQDLILKDKIIDYPIPQKDRIYIFEDIDCMGNLVENRKKKKEKEKKDKEEKKKSPINESNKEIKDFMMNMSKMMQDEENETKNNLSKLLNILDGVIETPGRIIILTTNDVDKLDPALIRPGRIDCKLNFTKCSRKMIEDILNNFYESDIKVNNSIEEYKYSPAELINLCKTYESIEDILKFLYSS